MVRYCCGRLKGEAHMNENESLTVTLTLENDEELECAVLTIFESDGREYIALLPLDENGDSDDGQVYLYRFIDNLDENGDSDDGQVYLYRFIDNGEGEEPGLENILEDEEFERVSEAFNDWMEDQDFGDIDLDDIE